MLDKEGTGCPVMPILIMPDDNWYPMIIGTKAITGWRSIEKRSWIYFYLKGIYLAEFLTLIKPCYVNPSETGRKLLLNRQSYLLNRKCPLTLFTCLLTLFKWDQLYVITSVKQVIFWLCLCICLSVCKTTQNAMDGF